MHNCMALQTAGHVEECSTSLILPTFISPHAAVTRNHKVISWFLHTTL